MYTTTHLALGLVIGKLTGDYQSALLGSLIIDIDHLAPALKERRLFDFKDLWRRSKKSTDSARSFLHGVIPWIAFSVLLSFFDLKFGLIFGLGYFGHLVLDALDDSPFHPFYPNKKINIKGFIPYYSLEELIFSITLFVAYLII